MIGDEQLQIAIYNHLTNTGLVVYSYQPKTATYPFVNLGEEYTLPAHTKNKDHWELYHTIHAWSQSKNKAEINGMKKRIIETLSTPFALADGFYISKTILESGTVLLDPDVEALFHGNFRFQFTVTKG